LRVNPQRGAPFIPEETVIASERTSASEATPWPFGDCFPGLSGQDRQAGKAPAFAMTLVSFLGVNPQRTAPFILEETVIACASAAGNDTNY
jgi:hypothetical protein